MLRQLIMRFRYEEDGIQDQTMAREVFLLRCLQESDRHEELYTARTRDLLCRMLRGQVRHAVC